MAGLCTLSLCVLVSGGRKSRHSSRGHALLDLELSELGVEPFGLLLDELLE